MILYIISGREPGPPKSSRREDFATHTPAWQRTGTEQIGFVCWWPSLRESRDGPNRIQNDEVCDATEVEQRGTAGYKIDF